MRLPFEHFFLELQRVVITAQNMRHKVGLKRIEIQEPYFVRFDDVHLERARIYITGKTKQRGKRA